MDESRREFLTKAASAGGTVLLVGGLVGGRLVQQSYARDSLHRSMMEATVPLLTDKSAKELEKLPPSSREEVREYFHGICLNVHGFVAEVCSDSFAERLRACRSEQQQHDLLNVAFSQKVVTATEVLNRVETIAKEAGTELDRNWTACCKQISESWSTSLSQRTSGREVLDVTAMVEPLIRASLQQARGQVYPVGQKPAVSDLLGGIGRTAILLLPIAVADPQVAFPVFVIAALKHLWSYVSGQLAHRPDNYQMAISEQLAVLGNRVGSEFEQEFRRRIADLHHWQERSLSDTARKKVQEVIPALL